MSVRLPDSLAWLGRWAASLRRVEVVAGAAILAGWSAAALGGVVPVPVAVVAAIGAIALHLAAVDTGSFSLLWLATGVALALITVAGRTLLAGADPILFTGAGITALAHNELLRATYAGRRGAIVDRQVRRSSTLGTVLAGLVALLAVGLAAPLADQDAQRSWLWTPLALGVVMLVLVCFTVGPTWSAPEVSKERWQPGDRLPPHRPHVSDGGTGADRPGTPAGAVGAPGRRR